jgi:hypothetical protein
MGGMCRDVLAYTLLKASGTIVWGAGNILSVRFSEMKQMQALGDSAFTLLRQGGVGLLHWTCRVQLLDPSKVSIPDD